MAINEAQIHYNKGETLYKQEKFDEAIKSFNKAIQLKEDYFEAYNYRGLAYQAKEDYQKAIDDYSSAIEINPKYTHAYNNRGNTYKKIKEYDKAIEDYTTALKMDSKYYNAYNGRGNVYTTTGKFHLALEDYCKAIELNPSDPLVYRNRGIAYEDLGKYNEAIEDFTKAIELDTNDHITFYNRGRIKHIIGNNDQAIADYTEAIRLKPDYKDAYDRRANSYLSKANNDRGIIDVNEALKIDNKFALAYSTRGIAYANKGEHDKALIDYSESIKITPKNEWNYYSRGVSLLAVGDIDSAIDDFSMALKLNSQYSAAREKRDEAYKLKGEAAQSGYNTAVKGTTYRRYKKKLAELVLPDEAKEKVEVELEKLNRVFDNDSPYDSSNFGITQNYLDTVLALPWDEPEPEKINLKNTMKILDEDHYGLKDVKTRILEFLAVRKMRKDTKGSILCLAGPPGVGKTTMGKSIARAIGKPFYRFSVGGVNDESSIRGGRRFYIGAEPGRIIHGLKTTKTKAPVILIDEIDKMAAGGGVNGGDPSAALLEVLDPEQNDSFRDHFLDIPFDLSNVFFIVTANYLDNIPEALKDRLEIIKLPGYIDEEKIQIAKRHLVPKSLEKNGLKKDQVSYTDEAILHVATAYEKEAGVRTLDQNIDKIHRKLVLQIAEKQEETEDESESAEKFLLDKKEIEKHLGKPRYTDDVEIKKADRPGIAVGLCVVGNTDGDTMLVEATAVPGDEGFTITGYMMHYIENNSRRMEESVLMKESVKIAYAYAKKLAVEKYKVNPEWFKKNHIYLHFPDPIPKEGNSAGITAATALLSLFINITINDKFAMTGEITLTGQVSAIGGLNEKIIGAKRNKAEHIIFPKQNLKDFEEIPDNVKEGIQFHPVERFEEVIALVLPD